ncbi:hypothetical protein A8C32_07555 [Flavivirga aquatica]|uniref:Cytochrome c domain-containing protein n=1 Tax=Flavivirga aquatica TaxID=1849968 RepID=A0A1E5SIT3_9FLAO|nr:cytochrome c [Flavivirga aquatica]OEJ99024.1 hypothetical protein A8C32_07555 [Flavivirga aquatica]
MIKKNKINTLLIIVVMFISVNTIAQGSLEESKKRGESIYTTNCVACHMANGEGITGAFPPLAKSDYLMENTKRAAKNIIEGVSGEMKVNGVSYYGAMVAYGALSDQEVADVLNYIRNSWGNKGGLIEVKTIKEVRKK